MASPGGFLRPASFRGVPFFARRDSRPFPRALQIDEYPASDRWSIVDLGRKAVTYKVDAYVADEMIVEARMRALELALETPGPGLLILPQRRPVMAWARAPESSWEGDKLGYFSFRIDFVEDGPAAGIGLSLGLAERLIVDALGAVAGFADAAGIRLDSIAADLRGVGIYEATAFAREGAARLAGLKIDALAITAETEVVEAVQIARGWIGHADIVEALSVAGDAGLTALEERAAA
jgi:hypothetical protein